ncbi:MAG: CpsD/CapB family tyrosine-protein kinase, partial [Clostridiales bacterium]|nr:CpsD/CapB family tyrosine-protein kinase [Clostridiales bacterium]
MAKINLDTDQTLNFETDESCRTLRTNIILHGEEIKAIAITSTLPKEGKTSVAFNLAKSLAMVGKKTLFIDGDLRKSTFKEQYEVDAETNGLGSLLSGKKELADVVYTTNIDDLDIVLSDAPNNNSPELLDSNYFKELIPSV